MMSFFSTDEKALKKFLEGDSAVDWSSPYIIAGELWAVQRNIIGACVLFCNFLHIKLEDIFVISSSTVRLIFKKELARRIFFF